VADHPGIWTELGMGVAQRSNEERYPMTRQRAEGAGGVEMESTAGRRAGQCGGQQSLEVKVAASVRQEAGWGRAGAGVPQGGPEEGRGRGRSADARG
jgi:hypothetical protein